MEVPVVIIRDRIRALALRIGPVKLARWMSMNAWIPARALVMGTVRTLTEAFNAPARPGLQVTNVNKMLMNVLTKMSALMVVLAGTI